MELIVSKIFIAFVLALFLVWMAEWKSVRISGIISSLPNSSLIIMLFIGLEQGVQFSKDASIYSIYGVLANLVLVTSAIFMSFKKQIALKILVPLGLYGLSLFVIVYWLPQSEEAAFVICSAIWLGCLRLVQSIPRHDISQVKKSKVSAVVKKFGAIAIVIVTTTYLAKMIGTKWAGVLTTFPGVTIPVAIFVALKYDGDVFRSFLKGAIFAWLPTAFYFLVIAKILPSVGPALGTLYSFISCLVFIGVIELTSRLVKHTVGGPSQV